MECRKRKGNDEAGSPQGWETIYCSLVLILVAFFAMLVTYSTVEGGRVTNFLRGFGSASTIYSTSISSDFVGRARIYSGGNKFDEGDNLSPSPDIIEAEEQTVFSSMEEVKRVLDEYRAQKISDEVNINEAGSAQSSGLQESVITNDLSMAVDAALDTDGIFIGIEKTAKGFKAVFPDSILFASSSADLDPAVCPLLLKVVKIIEKRPFSIRIEGHTDDVPINTSLYPSNWELSTARAVNILRYLEREGNIPSKRLSAEGFSQYRPVASNDRASGRRKNRRVEIYFDIMKEKSFERV